jgi:hypothetical protein
VRTVAACAAVAAVAGSPLGARGRDNFWIVNDPSLLATPCGLDWTAPGGVVLRTVASCTKDPT